VSSRTNHKTIIIILATLIFAISSLFLLRNIYDPDFFWHIKTGEWIWQHKSFPSGDPFAYTSPGHHTSREHFILTSFWLSQVTYHLYYLAGGLAGIAFLRFLIAGALLYAMWKRRHGDNIIYMGLMLIFLTCFLKQFPIERPQVFSFLFFAILLYMLEIIKGKSHQSRGRLIFFLFPVLMLIWANMHPGFIVGQATIILYIIMEGIKFLHPSFSPIEKQDYKRLCLAAASGIIFSLINPNTYQVWQEYWTYNVPVEHWNLGADYLSSVNPDYMSSIQYFLWSYDYTVVLYWLILILTIAAIVANLRKTDITDLTLLISTGFASFFTARYSFFFMAAALPVVARHFSRDRVLKFSRVVIPAIALFSGIFFSWEERINIESLRSGLKIDNYLCPVSAADFIISSDIRGNMYNVYAWGGYLIWRLAPGRQVFIDPRDIFEDIGRESFIMDNANRDEIAGMPIWKDIVRARGIEYIVIPIARVTGAVVPLFSALMQNDEWLPVFCDINAVIFVKNSPVNKHVIGKYSIPKDYLLNALIGLYSRLINTYPSDWKAGLYITKGDLYISQGNVSKAVEAYEKAVEIVPFNVTARERLNHLGRTNE
jgi:hypothetical protein